MNLTSIKSILSYLSHSSSLCIIKEKHFVTYITIFYLLFSLLCLGRYCYFLLAGRKSKRLQASSAINANAAL